MALLSAPARGAVAVAAVVAVVVLASVRLLTSDPYTLTLVMPAVDQTFEGGKVMMRGQQVGRVSELGVREGQALVTIEIDDDHAPLPAGTRARVKWLSVLGARVVELQPGAEGNLPLASGHLITGNLEGVEIDDLLATLDAPTRAQLQGLLGELDHTVAGHEKDLNATLTEAGPTILALGQVLRAVGEDGPAIKKIVTQLHGVTETVSARDQELAESVADLDRLTKAVAARQAELSVVLDRLPGTIGTATATLDSAEQPIDSARVLLRDVRPLTAQLPGIARDVEPVLAAARPALADLTPTLEAADDLLTRTPALLSGANELLPTLDDAVEQVNPMVAFLRPYTPELAGWLSNWVGIFGSQNSSGNYARALITASASSADDVLPGLPPGMGVNPRPAPGSLAGQPWTDANGDPIQ